MHIKLYMYRHYAVIYYSFIRPIYVKKKKKNRNFLAQRWKRFEEAKNLSVFFSHSRRNPLVLLQSVRYFHGRSRIRPLRLAPRVLVLHVPFLHNDFEKSPVSSTTSRPSLAITIGRDRFRAFHRHLHPTRRRYRESGFIGAIRR